MRARRSRPSCAWAKWAVAIQGVVCSIAVAGTEEGEIRLVPPRGEIPPGFWELHVWHVVAAALAALGLISLGLWRWMRPRPAVQIPPATQAREALEPLAEQPETGQVLSRVSQVLRGYFADVFGLPAGQLTTSEFTRAFKSQTTAEPGLVSATVRFLETCDQRKFAPNSQPTPLGAVPEALRLIALSEQQRIVAAGPAAAPGAGKEQAKPAAANRAGSA